ncbi:MAG: proline racemase family protein [Planctomycetota bacterium]|nr:proline racemase family protein [Planctomycetota bacterium]
MTEVQVIDSHTGGEPTRVVIDGGPDLGTGSVAQQLEILKQSHDSFRRAVINEPRGTDFLVGALLVTPTSKSCVAGVIFFDNVKFIGMCGHGTIGVVATLAYLGRISCGVHQIETPVGIVSAELHQDGSVSITNVPSFRIAKNVELLIPSVGKIVGDVAWGGNWFYLVDDHPCRLERNNLEQLTDVSWKIRIAINESGFPDVDHIILFAPDAEELNDPEITTKATMCSKNFVLCPGKAYDRSPCGTGTSALLACLASDGVLSEGETMVQKSIIGSHFTGRFLWENKDRGTVIPTITGEAYITAKVNLVFDSRDPFCEGIATE